MKSAFVRALMRGAVMFVACAVLFGPASVAAAGTLDSTWPGYADDDIVLGGIYSRSALLSHIGNYRPYGMNENFVYYSTVQDFSANTSTKWGGLKYWNSTSQASGAYWFTSINTVIVSPAGKTFSAWSYNGTFVARVCGNHTMSIQNPPPPKIAGMVWHDYDADGVKDAGEPQLSGWSVNILLGSTSKKTVTTDGAGNFTTTVDAAASMPPGSYAARINTLPSGWVVTTNPNAVAIAEGPASSNATFGGQNIGVRQIVPPVTTIASDPASPDGDNGWFRSPTTVTFTVNEPAATRFSLDSVTPSTVWLLSPVMLPEGETTVWFASTDTVGDVEVPKSASFKVDVTAPAAVTVGWEPVSLTQARISWTPSSDAVSGLSAYRVIDADTGHLLASTSTSETSAVLVDLDPRATYRVTVVAVDVAGNVSEPAGPAVFAIDDDPPSTTLTADPATPDGLEGWYVTAPEITLTPDEPAETRFALDAAQESVYAGPFVLGEGLHDVAYRSIDLAGNEEATRSASFKVDVTAPAAVTVGWEPVSLTQARISWTPSSDAVSGLSAYRVIDADTGHLLASTSTSETSAVLVDLDPRATYRVTVVAVDVAGNVSEPAGPAVFAIDDDPPSTTLTADPATPDGLEGWYVTAPEITLTPDEPAETRFALDAAQESVYAGPFVLGEGLHDVAYRSIDLAGNEEATRSASFKVDVTAPAVSTDVQASYVGTAVVGVTATDLTSGVRQAEVLLDGVVVGELGVVVSEPGEHELTVRAWDRAGNESDLARHIFSVVPEETIIEPIEGDDRYETATEISEEAFPEGAAGVILVSGANWPDGLGAAALGGVLDYPVLLTPGGTLPKSVEEEIARLDPAGVIIVGGQAAVASGLEDKMVEQFGAGNVERIAGPTRYETAALVARRVKAEIEAKGAVYDGTVFVATGVNFPDALAASPLAAAKGWPLLLVKGDGVPAEAVTAIQDIGATRALLLGGDQAVTRKVEGEIQGLGLETIRLEGKDRYETAVNIATYGVDMAGLHWNRLAIATGEVFPDALTGGILQGRRESVILLVKRNAVPTIVEDTLLAQRDLIAEMSFLGGVAAVDSEVRTYLSELLH